MNNVFVLSIILGTLVFVIINLLPIHVSPELQCVNDMYYFKDKQYSLGFPMTYISVPVGGAGDCSPVNTASSLPRNTYYYDNFNFRPLGFVVDSALAVAIVTAMAYALRNVKIGGYRLQKGIRYSALTGLVTTLVILVVLFVLSLYVFTGMTTESVRYAGQGAPGDPLVDFIAPASVVLVSGGLGLLSLWKIKKIIFRKAA